MNYDLTYISLGAGVQSSVLLACSALDCHDIPQATLAIFADTYAESEATYEHLWRLAEWSPIPIVIASRGDLGKHQTDPSSTRFLLPAFTDNGPTSRRGMLMRKCTLEYKASVIERAVRHYLGVKPRKKMNHRVRSLQGISLDETQRMKPSRTAWLTIEYPLIDARLTRADCLRIWKDLMPDWPDPPRSACIFCPFRSDWEWDILKRHQPRDYARACDFDEAIRDMKRAGVSNPIYLHESTTPLRAVDHEGSQMDFAGWNGECDGLCGV